MNRLFSILNPIEIGLPSDKPHTTGAPLSDETIWLMIAVLAVMAICGIISALILAKSVKKQKDKELRQIREDKEKETWRDY